MGDPSKTSAEEWIESIECAKDIALSQSMVGSYNSDTGFDMSGASSPSSTLHGNNIYPDGFNVSDRTGRNHLSKNQASLEVTSNLRRLRTKGIDSARGSQKMDCPRRSDCAGYHISNTLEPGTKMGLHATYFVSFVDAFNSAAWVRSCASHSWPPLRGPFLRRSHTGQKLYNSSLCVSHGSWLHCRSVYWLDTWEGI